VEGEARNQYGEQVTGVAAVVTLYDANGTVIGMDYEDINPTIVDPGATAAFAVEVNASKYEPDQSKVASYKLQVTQD
jgi:hypothetical protein